MSEIYLVTGFLGAGKTTFLKQFIPLFTPGRLRIIVNEFGRESIDGELLRAADTQLDEIVDGSIFCTCRFDQFEKTVCRVMAEEVETIVVETSGLTDTSGAKQLLTQDHSFAGLTYKGCICLVDLARFQKVYQTAVVIKKQLSSADVFILNKADLVAPEVVRTVTELLHTHRPQAPIYVTDHGRIQTEWIASLTAPKVHESEGLLSTMDVSLRKFAVVLKQELSRNELEKFIRMFMNDTYRVKGFVTIDGAVYQVDAVGGLLDIVPYPGQPQLLNELVVLSGYGLPAKKSIKEALRWYPQAELR